MKNQCICSLTHTVAKKTDELTQNELCNTLLPTIFLQQSKAYVLIGKL